MTTLKIALDWTPNINHIGFFIAKELGFYEENGIALEIINPLDDNYTLTPGKKLELDVADFAIAPFETVISLNNKKNKVDAIAIFTLLQEDISSIASLKSNNLTSPKLLDNKIYASYKARYEDKIVKELVKNDGGSGNIKITYPNKLGIWHTLIEGKADATWIFDNWEGVEATSKNIELNTWRLKDSGIPYGYSPVIIAKKSNIKKFKNAYASFIKATRKGYLFATKNEVEAVRILNNYLTEQDQKNINIPKTLAVSKSYFGTNNTCGFMNVAKVDLFLNWLVEKKLEDAQILNQHLFTNELLT
ncbi:MULTISPECIES: ABC transporter substrate-binding protein [unclassified Polaribacter]|uniref:ABC transporter substrate-binding protein n=1 Tax=unclassified Polaribacter TaxID=196858 RepID=UPI0011BEC663|nr:MULTISPECIES: ABC transporter substrate-binding protein [unclassified Polaribacter]TXD51570.1 ABC transporter substrate-binding protein [Polaribacter sp. IC063]TXD61934.1 ABC transporter substrate-binding protein [Polaribacter sp. IC066]